MAFQILFVLFFALDPLFQASTVPETNTTYFRIKYDKSISSANLQLFSRQLEESYEQLQSIYHVSFHDRMDVRLMNSSVKYHAEVKTTPFDDGCFSVGKMYFVIPKTKIDRTLAKKIVDRVLTSALLSDVVECPQWLTETFALYFGESMDDFGEPAQFTFRGFDDLAEEMTSADSKNELKELYAKLGATAKFFVNRYGEKKFLSLINALKADTPFEKALPETFGEKFSDIERSWVRSFRTMR